MTTEIQTQDIRLADVIAPSFYKVHNAIKRGGVKDTAGRFWAKSHFWLRGGRGSTKSSFAAIQVVLAIKRDPKINVVVLRKIADTMRDSVYAQIVWAIGILGLTDEFKMSVSPMEITYRPTGQRVLFRGVDKPEKLKSIKVPVGYIGFVWFEELDQFAGMAEIRSLLQSLLRGGEKGTVLYSYNPPRTRDSWVNKEARKKRADRIVHTSDYRDVPREWLGDPFYAEIEALLNAEGKTDKQVDADLRAYRHEYLGEETGTGGTVFDNVTLRPISDKEIEGFDWLYNGVDWGFFPDPWVYGRMCFEPKTRTLYIFDEAVEVKASNAETAGIVKEKLGEVRDGKGEIKEAASPELVTCDSSSPQNIAEYRDLGIDARPVAKLKGPRKENWRRYSMEWLSWKVAEIVIDPERAPFHADEFVGYEYEQTKDGEFTSGYPDKNNHSIDEVRYAMSGVINRRQ